MTNVTTALFCAYISNDCWNHIFGYKETDSIQRCSGLELVRAETSM